PERIVEHAIVGKRERGGVEEPVGTLLLADRRIHEVRESVVLGRLPQIAELHAVGIVAALDEVTAVVRVRQVRADAQVVEQPVRSLEAGRGAREIVVRPDEYAVLIAVVSGQVKRGAVIPARYGHPIVERVPDAIDLVRVVINCGAGGKRRAPGPPALACQSRPVSALTGWGGIAGRPGIPSAERRLQRIRMVEVVER